MAPYERSSWRAAIVDLMTSTVPFLVLAVVMYLSLDVSYWLTLAISIPTSGFLLRNFIVFHDCGHGSFTPSRRANTWIGRFTGLLVMQPFANWRWHHAMHHGSAGDLDRRGTGDVETLTVAEYEARSFGARLAYRAFRSPFLMFTIGPVWSLMINPRKVPRDAKPALRRSIITTNIVLAVVIAAICVAIGWQEYLLIQMPIVFLAGGAGVWLFYVQHQFEDVYWERGSEWSFVDAALEGSSYLKLPKVLQYFTGNIGLHHVHHLSARVPNYNLQRAHDGTPLFADVPVLTIGGALRSVRLKLWDEDSGRLVSFAEARRASARRAVSA